MCKNNVTKKPMTAVNLYRSSLAALSVLLQYVQCSFKNDQSMYIPTSEDY